MVLVSESDFGLFLEQGNLSARQPGRKNPVLPNIATCWFLVEPHAHSLGGTSDAPETKANQNSSLGTGRHAGPQLNHNMLIFKT